MKKNLSSSDPNIEIYTVGFQLTTTASKNLMKGCASGRPLLRDVERRRLEGGVPRHRLEDLEVAPDELSLTSWRGSSDGRQRPSHFFAAAARYRAVRFRLK